MILEYRDDIGLVVDGHGHDPDELEAAAKQWLREERGFTPLAARGPWPMAEAWWGDDERGFVQAHHDGATPITVVTVPKGM